MQLIRAVYRVGSDVPWERVFTATADSGPTDGSTYSQVGYPDFPRKVKVTTAEALKLVF
jgi:hypothetical protein